ncbi:HNH endonuclease [Kineococcus sp. DHX-1]|uniref:HNH endonuclease n=1 Tax=Kineococcus sp. DHX-1 TaxID=3349638 RepID=UPI0036D3D3F9
MTSTAAPLEQMTPAQLVDVITEAERQIRALLARQVQATARYAQLMTGRAGGEAATTREIALARQVSPSTGTALVAAATVLVQEMPVTLTALAEGLITERAARDVVTATCHVSPADRARIDERMRREYRRPGLGHRYLAGAARALADAADPAAAVERNRRAEGTRRCTVRPGADHMTFFTAVGTPAANLTLLTTLRRAATDQLRADPSDERTEDQAMYDVLFARVTGAELVTDPIPVTEELVMDEAALLREGTSSARVWCEGVDGGPVPAQQARDLVRDAAEREQTWIRRLYCRPGTDELVAMDAKSRLFPPALARYLRRRDQRCATPWCEAPIRHVDHVIPWSRGGGTSIENGQGLCRSCNYTKDLPGFTTTSDERGRTVLTVRTGHRYRREPPPVLGHPTLPERRRRDRRRSGSAVP